MVSISLDPLALCPFPRRYSNAISLFFLECVCALRKINKQQTVDISTKAHMSQELGGSRTQMGRCFFTLLEWEWDILGS